MTESWILRGYPCRNCGCCTFFHNVEIQTINLHGDWPLILFKVDLICINCNLIGHTILDHLSIRD